MYKKLLLLAALGIPQLSFAQAGPASARFYVGVGANFLTDMPFTSGEGPNLLGPSLTAGMQLTPRLALQISGAYQWKHKSYTYPFYPYGSGAVASDVTVDFRYKYVSVPVLLRYTFTEPAERLQFDGLAGLTLLHSRYKSDVSSPLLGTGYPSYPSDFSSSSTNITLSLGPAVRYRVAPNVELTANGLANVVLTEDYYRFSDRLFLNLLVGVHYTFGAR